MITRKLLPVFLLPLMCMASGIHPDWYLLQVTSNESAIIQSGPAPYSDWFYGPGYGEVAYLIYTAVPQHIISTWTLVQCPATTDCSPTYTPAPSHPPVQSGTETPEPGTMGILLVLGAALVVVIGRKNRNRRKQK